MAKDHEWEARHQEGQAAIEKRRKEEEERKRQEEERARQAAIEEAKRVGNWCPYCQKILPIQTRDEEEHFHGPIGGGADFTTIWHVEFAQCDACGYKKEFKRWKDKDLFEKFIDWIKSWFD